MRNTSLQKLALDQINKSNIPLPNEQFEMIKEFVNLSSSSRKSTKSKSPKSSRGGFNKTHKKSTLSYNKK